MQESAGIQIHSQKFGLWCKMFVEMTDYRKLTFSAVSR